MQSINCQMRMLLKMFRQICFLILTIIMYVLFFSIGHNVELRFRSNGNEQGCDCDVVDNTLRYACGIYESGNPDLYNEYLQVSVDEVSHFPISRIGYSLLMSNVYNNKLASFDIYNCLRQWDASCRLDSLNEATRQVALYYLEKAAYEGNKTAINTLDSLQDFRPKFFVNRRLKYTPNNYMANHE